MVDSTVHGPALDSEPNLALTLPDFLRDVCTRFASKEALVFDAPDGTVLRRSYKEVWDEANAFARALIARGVTKDTRVGLLATNRPEWITAMFGTALAGGTCVALSTFAKAAELEHQLRVGDVSLLIVERDVSGRDFVNEIVELCPELAGSAREIYSARLPFLRRAIVIDERPASGAFEPWREVLRAGPFAPTAIVDAIGGEVSPPDRALVFFSSGSTAKPKAVMHTQRAAALQCQRFSRIFGIDPDVRTWTANGFFWSGNFAMAVGATFAAGGCLVLQRYFAPGEALRLMQRERVSLPLAWPHQWARLVEDPSYRDTDLKALKYVGDTSPLRQHPSVRTDWQEPMSAYGNTETLTLSAAHPSGTPDDVVRGNHGVPLAGNTLRVVDPVTGRLLARNEVGEIAVKGPTLMLGYLRVVPEQSFDDEGFFRTGDGGLIDDQGRLHWRGRLNDIIKTGGANVSPLEVDAVLRTLPGVQIAATVGVPHDTLGEIVVACVVRDDTATLDEAAVRRFVGERLSSYKVPRRVLFVQADDLTLTGSNKVKTAPLRELASRRLAEI